MRLEVNELHEKNILSERQEKKNKRRKRKVSFGEKVNNMNSGYFF